jgi:hypothetical protein
MLHSSRVIQPTSRVGGAARTVRAGVSVPVTKFLGAAWISPWPKGSMVGPGPVRSNAVAKRSSWSVMQFDTLRLRLIKIAARVVELKKQIKIPSTVERPRSEDLPPRPRPPAAPDHLKTGQRAPPSPFQQTVNAYPTTQSCKTPSPAPAEVRPNHGRCNQSESEPIYTMLSYFPHALIGLAGRRRPRPGAESRKLQ